MFDFNYLPGDLSLNEVTDNVSPAHQTLQDLFAVTTNNLQNLSLSQRKRDKLFAKTLEHDTLKKNLQFRIAQYTEPQFTEATL